MICTKHYKDCGKAIYSQAHSIVYCGERNFNALGLQCEVKMREDAEEVKKEEQEARDTFIKTRK